MNKVIFAELEAEVLSDLSIEYRNEEDFDEDVLAVKVRSVIKEIIGIRGYRRASYTDEMIVADLWNYQAQITSIARYDYNMIGAEGEQSHSESDVSRTWVKRSTLFVGIVPLAIC